MASRKRGSRSVATTCPLALTWRQSHSAMEPPPPAISKQCQPSLTPTLAKFRIVRGPPLLPSSDRRSRAPFHSLLNGYLYSATKTPPSNQQQPVIDRPMNCLGVKTPLQKSLARKRRRHGASRLGFDGTEHGATLKQVGASFSPVPASYASGAGARPPFPLTGHGIFRLEPGLLDDRPPFFGIGFNNRAESLRRLLLARENLLPEIGEPRSHRRIGQRVHGRRVELGDDVLRRALGREKTCPDSNRKAPTVPSRQTLGYRARAPSARRLRHSIGFYAPRPALRGRRN